jgi:two-component system, OmpR family, response regulator
MSESSISVLLIEDDERLALFTSEYLQKHGVVVTHVTDGLRGLAYMAKHNYDAVLLDIMLPGRDGLEVCKDLRARSAVPIIMLTAKTEEIDRVLGLELGADDYVSKPFSSRELLARIRAVVRRDRGSIGPVSTLLQVGELQLDTSRLTVMFGKQSLQLTTYEFTLLRVFAERPGRVLTREQLMDLVKGTTEESFDRSIDVHISRLRQKLNDDPKRPKILKTMRGVGYVLSPGGEVE